ncbi:MAG TPA: CPBP family intramembrane glutamic endopeptidase [Candidatus Babeliales bacterium]|nr:CPBP family intramembrane glutamic endopeptidase [Candidatus Babeliales bacterium]
MNSTLTLFLLLAAILLYGYLFPRIAGRRLYTLFNLGFALFSVWLVKKAGANWGQLGFSFSLSSIAIALVVLLIVISAELVFFKKNRLEISAANLRELLVRIPFGTALAEEMIFRGSLIGVLLLSYSRFWSLLISSAIFGIWHLLPGPSSTWTQQNLMYKNKPRWLARLSSDSVTVLVTTFGGLFFGWLRLASGGILLPWVFHSGINIVSWTLSGSFDFKSLSRRTSKVGEN